MSELEPPYQAVQPQALGDHFACELRVEGHAGAWVLARGELDLASSPQFEHTVEDALEHAQLVILDLRELTFMDSSGVNAIIKADGRARANGKRLVLVRGPAQVQRLLTLVGIASRLEVVDLRNGEAPASAPSAVPTVEAEC